MKHTVLTLSNCELHKFTDCQEEQEFVYILYLTLGV